MSQPGAIRSGPLPFALLALVLLGAACDAAARNAAAIPRDSIIARLADLRAIHTPEGI